MDFISFFWAFFADWVGWMSGLASLVLAALGLFRPTTNQKKAFFIAAALCFIVSCVHIWTIEHRARLAAEDNNRPKLKASIVYSSIALMGQETVMILQIEATNLGAPSILKFDRCDVTLRDGREIRALLIMKSIEDVLVAGLGNTPNMVFKASDYLPEKGMRFPVERGGAVTGWAMFIVPEVSRNEMPSNSTNVQYLSEDVTGNLVVAETVMGSKGTSGMYLPQRRPPQ